MAIDLIYKLKQLERGEHDWRDYATPAVAKSVAATAKEVLKVLEAKLHERRCWFCKHEFWAADSVSPYCRCDECHSMDTRRIKRSNE